MPQGNSNYPWIRRQPRHSTFPTGDPRWARRISPSLQGTALRSLPIVTTVGVNTITNTSANVVGAVSPNGSDTVWFVAYGTQLPLSPGTFTTTADIGSGTTPITVTFSLAGLTPNLTYYVAVVGQSAGGTVYGQTVSFIAATPPVTTSRPASPFGQALVTIPHFEFPFSLVGPTDVPTGVAVTEQDTVEEIAANVGVIMACPIGACSQLPSFGRTDVTFAQEPINTTEIETSIQLWEPRATEDIVSQLMPDGQTWGLTLGTSTTAAQTV